MIANQLVSQLLGKLSFFFPKRMRSGTVVEVCIIEDETDCVWLAVCYEK
jgi:hypothetical protein